MLELLTSQSESNRQFRRWKDVLVAGSTVTAGGWVIQGQGVAFTNYGWGAPGELGSKPNNFVDFLMAR